MRIIAGKYRGRLLRAPAGWQVRPTGNKVREALFDILGEEVAGTAFLDLFAGTGAVGLESLSRGASRCVFVEENPAVIRILRQNLNEVAPDSDARVMAVPAARAIQILGQQGFRARVLFADPPYSDSEWATLLLSLPRYDLIEPGGALVVEHNWRSPQIAPPGFSHPKTYRYGDTALSLFRSQ